VEGGVEVGAEVDVVEDEIDLGIGNPLMSPSIMMFARTASVLEWRKSLNRSLRRFICHRRRLGLGQRNVRNLHHQHKFQPSLQKKHQLDPLHHSNANINFILDDLFGSL
jgi:hypothetical protein